jgi:ABC-2 type transport system ATP-binding protein
VDHVSFSIAAGEVFALIGPNGAGKSTLMKMFTTMLPPTSGQAIIAGFDVAAHPRTCVAASATCRGDIGPPVTLRRELRNSD